MQKMFRVNVRPAQKEWHEKGGTKRAAQKALAQKASALDECFTPT